MKKTSLYPKHIQLKAKMVPFAGYEMPVSYSGIKEEHLAVRNNVGLFDVSHMGEFVVTGPDAERFLQWVCSNDIAKLVDLQAQYNCLPNEQNGIVDDLIVYKWNNEKYNLVVNAANILKDWNWLSKQIKENGFKVKMEDISDKLSLLAVQGPKAKTLIQELSDINLGDIKFYHFNAGKVAGVSDVVISNTGYTGSGGFELYVWNKDAETLWDALLETGKKYHIKPCGLAARDTLRLEMGYCLYGNDINETTNPIEAGLGWITKFNKEFVNSKNLKAIKESKPARRLVGFEMVDKGIPRKDYQIKCNNENIGVVTSGTMSPSLGEAIGMGYVREAFVKPNTEFDIQIRNKTAKAKVVKLPFYKG